MFTLDAPITASGGFGGLPPTKDARPFKRPEGNNPLPKASKPKAVSVPSPAPIALQSYPKPCAWVEKRISLCAKHHSRFIKWRKANIAKLQAWVISQPGYDETQALVAAHEAKIRQAYRARGSRAQY